MLMRVPVRYMTHCWCVADASWVNTQVDPYEPDRSFGFALGILSFFLRNNPEHRGHDKTEGEQW